MSSADLDLAWGCSRWCPRHCAAATLLVSMARYTFCAAPVAKHFRIALAPSRLAGALLSEKPSIGASMPSSPSNSVPRVGNGKKSRSA